jgi:hypothetical protein
VNRSELNWLLQTIKSAEMAERFLLAQYERGRISPEMLADVARERGWINPTAKEFAITTTRDLTEYATTEFSVAVA